MAHPTISNGAKVVASPRQVSTQVEGEVVILEFEEGIYYGLDRVGARIWELLQDPVTVVEVRDKIVGEYEVDPDRCAVDVESLLSELAEAGLVEVADAGSA